MKKFLGLLTVAVCALILSTSCNGSKVGDNDKVTLTVEAELGELSDYLSITDKEVTVTLSDEKKKKDDEEKEFKVVAASLAIAVQKAVASDDDFTFEVEVLDENHVKVSDLPEFRIESNSDYDNGDLNYFLNKGNIRAVMEDGVEVSKWDENDGQKVWDKICAKGKYIVIKLYHSSAKYAEYKKGGSTVESSDDVVSDDVASADFDEWLDSYEEFCTEYIELLKKASQGDMDALSEYPNMLQKAQELGEKMQNAQGEATPEQWAKYIEIQKKLTKAASSLN